MNLVLYDGPLRNHFLPFTFTRPVADMRIGILTIREKWEYLFQTKTSSLTEAYLSKKYPLLLAEDNVFIDASIMPSNSLKSAIEALNKGEALIKGEHLIAYRNNAIIKPGEQFIEIEYAEPITALKNNWDLFLNNGEAIRFDFEWITQGKESDSLPDHCKKVGEHPIFIEKGASVSCSIFNTESGPIYIGKNCQIMEGCLVRGPFAMNDGSILKMGAKIYGPTTLGPYCKVGGEVNNSILFGYSNKGHDGFLGNSVLGEWCNLGADTNTSNLKNDYTSVRLWNYSSESFVKTGEQFCGLLMGDHSKSAIDTMFNTGTVVGVNATIFGSGFVKNFIPSFSWGGERNSRIFKLEKALETASLVMERRGIPLSDNDSNILKEVYEQTKKWRKES
jgi:UDP-N-acetylglucosamine diphosphorylase/glucosamine-1-phosphate N-acetyltransferase